MFTDFLGACLNLTQLAGSQSTYRLEFVNDSEEAIDLSGATFSGTVTASSAGSVYPLGVAASLAATNILGLSFPDLALGNYHWELMATDDSGDSRRIVYGQLLVISTSLALSNDGGGVYKTLQVREPAGEARSLQLRWLSSSLAQLSAEEAAAAAKEASTALDGKLDAAVEAVSEARRAASAASKTLEEATSFMAQFWDNVRASIVINTETGTWWIGGVDTFWPATGEDGQSPYIDGAGHWRYYDATTGLWLDGGAAQGEDGHSPYIGNDGFWVTWFNGEWVNTGVQAQGSDGLDGNKVRRIIVPDKDHIPQSGETCNGGFYYYCPWYDDEENRHFDVYAWLESDDGSGSWVCVGEANDIATAEIYGLVRLGTDTTVQDGAPVGNDASGQMSVPHADYTTPGTVRPATADVLEDGGAVGFDAEGRMVTQAAAYGRYGAMKPSTSSMPGTWCIGINSDGTAGVNWAGLNSAGVVKLGSQFGQSNPIPYQQGVGATEDHKLANNLVYGGALQHMSPSAWGSRHMDWLDSQMSETPQWFGDAYYLGLATSGQFAQSQGRGLELLASSTTLLGGVYLAESLDDERTEAVVIATQVKALAQRLYTKEEVDALLAVQQETIVSTLKAWVIAQGYDTAVSVNSKLAGYVKTTDSVTEIQALTTEEFNNLDNRDDTTLYLN